MVSVVFAVQVLNQCLFCNEQGLDKLLPKKSTSADRSISENRREVLEFIPRIPRIGGIKAAIRGTIWSFMWKTPSLNVRFLFLQRRQENM